MAAANSSASAQGAQSPGARAKAAILAVAFVVMSGNAVSPLLAGMAESFPEAGMGGVQLIMVISMLAGLVSTLAVGVLSKRLPMRALTLTALVLLAVGGLMPLALHGSIGELYVSGALMGLGQGMCIPMVQTYVARFFQGDEKSTMFGWQTTSKNVGAMVLLMGSGALAVGSWVRAYLMFLLLVPVILIAFAGLPKGEPIASAAGSKSKGGVAAAAVGAIVIICLFTAGYSTQGMNLSLFLKESALGDSVATSFAMSLTTALAAAAGLCFKPVLKALKSFVLVLAALLVALGMALTALASSMVLVYAGAVLAGFGFGLALSGVADGIARVSKPQQIPLSMSLYAAATTIGGALSPAIVGAVAGVFGGASPQHNFLAAAVLMAVVAALGAVWSISVRSAYAERDAK